MPSWKAGLNSKRQRKCKTGIWKQTHLDVVDSDEGGGGSILVAGRVSQVHVTLQCAKDQS